MLLTISKRNTLGFTKAWLMDNIPWVVMHRGSKLVNVMEIDPEAMTMRIASTPLRVDPVLCEVVSTTHRLREIDIDQKAKTIHVHLDHETTRSVVLTSFALALWVSTLLSMINFYIAIPLFISSVCMSYACFLQQKRVEENSDGIDCTPPAVHLSR
jgi:hypothetical protein